MKNNLSLSIIVLVKNEEVNLEYTLQKLSTLECPIFIVDSSSTDNTIKIAKKYQTNIYNYEAKSFSDKLNWAIDNLPIKTQWTMRVDADESLTDELVNELKNKLDILDKNIFGIIIKKRTYFLNRWIKYGGMYPIFTLRIWKTKQAFCEQRILDEHIILKQGESIVFNSDIIDNDRKSIFNWIAKHNNYSTNEALLFFSEQNEKMSFSKKIFIDQAYRNRYLRNKLYYKTPLFIRPFILFIYRYFFQLGFLDGKEGFVRYVLHSFWYRFVVDVKIFEIQQHAKKKQISPESYIKQYYQTKF